MGETHPTKAELEAQNKKAIEDKKKAEEREKQKQKEFEDQIKELEKQKKDEEIKKLEAEEKLRKEKEEQKLKEKEEREKKEKETKIQQLRDSQDITAFLNLIKEFRNNYDYEYLKKTLDAFNEKEIVKKYNYIKEEFSSHIQLISEIIFYDNIDKIGSDCLKKLMIILLFYEKLKDNIEDVVKKSLEKPKLKDFIFDIMLDYSELFGEDIKFVNVGINVYKEFVDYSISKGLYSKSLKYLSNNITQLNLLFSNIDKIFNTRQKIVYEKLNDYKGADKIIKDLIEYQEKKKSQFIYFPTTFWKNYYSYYKNNENDYIKNILELYKLLLLYISLGEDIEYKYELAEKIHKYIENKIKDIKVAKEQINLLFNYDPYYLYHEFKNSREPKIFKNIDICDFKTDEEIKYFQKYDLENIYGDFFKDYLEIIIEKSHDLEKLNMILNLTIIKEQDNKNRYITLLLNKYKNINELELNEECEKSFINFFDKVIEYTPKKKIEVINECLIAFRNNYNIYLKVIEKYKNDLEILKQISKSSNKNLENIESLIELIKNIKEEDQKKEYFNNLKERIITYDEFLKKEESDNLKLLAQLMKNNLIPESIYLDKNKDILNTIYDKLSTYDEKKSIYLNTILNEKEETKKIYENRFELIKLAKEDKFIPKIELKKIIDKYKRVKNLIEKAYNISYQLSFYYKEKLKNDIDKINSIYKDYLNKDIILNKWISKEKDIFEFIKKFEKKADLIKSLKEIILFRIIYEEFSEGDEIVKFDNSKKSFDECKIIFTDINKGNHNILNKWQNYFKKEKGINDELKKLKEYYKINDTENTDKIAKNIMIFTKKNIYYEDIKYLLNFLKLFEVEATELSNILNEKKLEFEGNDHIIDFTKLEKINEYLECKEIYINDGKDDSDLIKLVRLLNDKQNQINFIKSKDVDSAAALIYRLNPTADSLRFEDILQYQNCVSFINNIGTKIKDYELLTKIKEKLKKDKVDVILFSFQSYFINYESIKALDDFDSSKDVYQDISKILNNSEFKIQLFKREFRVYDDNKKEIKINANNLDGLIELKDNINLNFESLPDNMNENKKREFELKRNRIKIFVRYIEQLQQIIKYFSILESKGCPFLIDIVVTALKDNITFELVNNRLKYKLLILKLKEYCNAMAEYQLKFYKENEYFRFVYEKQLYRLFKRTKRRDKDISSYIRFFTNGDSIKDDVPFFESRFTDQSKAYKFYREAIEDNFKLISKYIENIFIINNTSLNNLYEDIKVKEIFNLKGVYKCNIQKSNMELFIIKIFLKLTDGFPIAQNILLTNKETSTGEIYSFMYRAIKCRFNTLFIISISDDFSIQNLNIMTNLVNQIISDMKKENTLKTIEDLKPCILFLINKKNSFDNSRGILDVKEIKDLPEYIKGDEDKLDYSLKNDGSEERKNSFKKNFNLSSNILRSSYKGKEESESQKNETKSDKSIKYNEIYDAIKIFTSDCCGLGKTKLIKKKIKENGQYYYYLGIGDDITKDYLFKKLKKMIKRDIKGKRKVGVHLDLFYTKNIPLMQYFLFSFLITKLYQVSDNILYIPKNINIYVEIPNGPLKFLDDFPLLNIFNKINISLDNQEPLDIDENALKKLSWANTRDNIDKNTIIEQNGNPKNYIEKQIYMNVLNYLSSDNDDDRQKYCEDAKKAASYLAKCVYSDKLKKKDKSLKDLTQEEFNNKYIFDFLDFKDEDALEIQYNAPLIFKTKNGYIKIDIPKTEEKIDDKEKINDEEKVEDKEGKEKDDKRFGDSEKDLEYYLSNLKSVMSLDQSLKEIKDMIGDYKITEDNYKKMLLILFRIFANIPVILMGETGCGKTELIRQLMKMLNKGDEEFLIIKNMHSGVKESEIEEIIKQGEKKLEESKSNIICIFFDEINTTTLLSKMKEIFVSHSINGKAINEKIRFIGACNPYRRKKIKEKEEGLTMNESGEEMTYLVNPLPNSLLNYIFYFKSLEDSDTIKYIESIVGAEFPKGEKKESENSILRNNVIKAIFESHNYVRNENGESSVSLRDLQRFKRAYKFFNKYYEYKVEFMKNNEEEISDKVKTETKIQSFVLSLFITYFIRIFKSGHEKGYLEIVNSNILNLAKSLLGNEHKWFKDPNWKQRPFEELVKKEEDFLIKEMHIENEKGIGVNNSLMENIFLMFFSIYSHIPLIVVGKPGCSKSLSIQLIIRIMRGEFSNSNFLKKYPKINSTGFQGSETNTPESIKKIFDVAENKIEKNTNDEEKIISLLIFDELGLSEKSPTNCLKVLHSKLEMSLNPKEKKLLSFIGISNWRLDAAKMNRTIFLSIPDMGLDDIDSTVRAIAKSYHPEIYNKYENEYTLLGKNYFDYKYNLKENNKKQLNDKSQSNNKLENQFNENFHGGRDLYHLVKVFSSEMMKNNMSEDPNIIKMAIKKSFSRNLSGLEINGKSILDEYIKDIKFDDIRTMDLIKDNIQSKESRFLLLISESSMFNFLMNIIENELEQMNKEYSNKNPLKYVNYIGSPFKGDKMNISYQTEMIVNIENSVAEGKVIILNNLDQIYSIFYDLFNQNYIIKDNKKYCRISHGANIQKLALVNENTKFIILVDKNDLRKQKLPFLSRFEKHIIKFDILLDEKDKEKSKNIDDFLKKMISVKNINYNLDNLLVNTNRDIINGYVYLYKDKENNSYKNIIEDKIIPIIPQDIIFTLPFSELKDEKSNIDFIKKNYNNFISLKNYLESNKRGKEEILIVYTFSGIGQAIFLNEKRKKEDNGIKESYIEKVASEIKSVFKFKQILNDFYEIKEYNTLILKFGKENAVNINYFISEINHYKEINQIKDNNKKYIFTVNIERQFNSEINNKITTVLITDENIKQLFIDNINGTESMNEIEGKSINNIIDKGNLNPKKLIIEGMLKFYGENNNEQIGKCKGIDTNNLIKEFEAFIENSDDLVNQIKKIIISQINKNEKIVYLLIKNKSINQNTIDFCSAIYKYIEEAFNNKIKELLIKSENNNFITTIFMLNTKDLRKQDSNVISSNKQLKDYSFNKADEQLLKNELFKKIQNEFFQKLKEEDEKNEDTLINIKLYYKIPAFFNIYKEIKKYIQDEKLASHFRQDETELRKYEYEYSTPFMAKLKDDAKDFVDKIYDELASKQLATKVIEAKINDPNYIEFTEVFLNDYITFYLVNLYKNAINDFVINDVQHKIILLLLDLKFQGLNEDEKFDKPLQNVISKILWLEGNSNYIRDILDLYKIISENIVYDKTEEELLFKEILNLISQNKIKYEPKEKQLVKVNIPYYIIFIILFKCMINEKAIEIAVSKNDNYYLYFENLEICLKIMHKLDKILKLDIKELSILDDFIMIYKVFEHAQKLDKLNINELIINFTKNFEIIEKNEATKINSLLENLKKQIENIKEALYDLSKKNEIKGDKVYYELISNLLLNEIKRENNIKYKIKILNEFLLKDEKLFIQSNQLLIKILDNFVSSDIILFQGSLDKLSDPDLKELECLTNNDWIKETLIYTFEQISYIYIENLIYQNAHEKKENQSNILYNSKSFLENCTEFLEKLFKDPELNDEDDEKMRVNKNLKKLFSISFTRIYLKLFIEWIHNKNITKNEIKEIIDVINGKDNNKFREMLMYFILKILYYMNKQDISILYDENEIDKYNLRQYHNFELILNEQNKPEEFSKYIVFIEAYKKTDEDYKIFKEEFELLTSCLINSGDKENELKKLINSNNRIDIFYSVFLTKISSHIGDKDKISLLSNIIHNIFEDKEKLTNIFDLFLDKKKYTKADINSNILEILQFSLKFCINADEIIEDYDNIYNPLYCGDKEINSYIPGNDIKNYKIFDSYSKIKNYLNNNPSNYGVYICTCNINEENKELYVENVKGTGYPEKAGKCKYCQDNTGNDGKPNSFYNRDNYYRIFKNEQDLEKETKNKGNGNCITLEKFFNDFIFEKFEADSKGINISSQSHFIKNDKPIRKQSQLSYRLMNLILYSHLFTNVLFTNNDEIFASADITYLDYIKGNWNKLKKILDKMGINIHSFIILIYKDLSNYLNKNKQINSYDELLEIEKEIETIISNMIENKINKKTEKIKDKEYSKYSIFASFYKNRIKDFRDLSQNNKTSIIKEINDPENIKENEYPYYKSFLYSDYPNEIFLRKKLEEIGKEAYPIIDIYLNREKQKKVLSKEFISFNFVIKSLLNQYSYKISREAAKKLTFEKTPIYKEYKKICESFINKINSKNNVELNSKSRLLDFLLDSSTENGKLYKKIYNEYSKIQNDLLNDTIKKINEANLDIFECQEINIQEAQKRDLLTLEFENKSEFLEILLTNTFREIYNPRSKIKYNNYNLFSINFDKIEKLLEDGLIKNAYFLKTDEIVEMIYTGEDYLNDGISELNKKIPPKDLDEKDKKAFIIFYEKYLKENLDSCLEVNEGIKNIILYVYKNNKDTNNNKAVSYIVNEGGFHYKINDDFKGFLNVNTNIIVSKLSNLMIYLEKLYFKSAIEKEGEEFKEKLNDEIKNKIDKYYNDKNGQFIRKDKLSSTIIRFILNLIMNRKNQKVGIIEGNEKLFDYLDNKFLWDNKDFIDDKFINEIKEYKNFNILVKNAYDFYSYIANDSISKFDNEITEILGNIREEEKEKERKEKKEQREKKKEQIEKEEKEDLKNEATFEDDQEEIDDIVDL